MDVEITTFRPIHAHAFETLNRTWLVAHGLLEHEDEAHLADPWGRIVAPGGQIFLAMRDQAVVGTCAVVPEGADTFELVKLTVAAAQRGHGIGRRLVEACLAFAREHNGRRVVLLSNSGLATAVRLYETLGFRHCPLPPDAKYATADVYMEYVIETASSTPAAPGRLRAVKALHSAVWAFFVTSILGVWVAAGLGRYDLALACVGIVTVEILVLFVNGWACPLTAIAARYTTDRRANFDIYLPEWLARWNKEIFGAIFVGGLVFTWARWLGWLG